MSPHTDAGALLKLAELLKRLEQCRDSRPLVYALDHTETFTVGDLRQAASHGREGGERSEVQSEAPVAWRYRLVTSVDGREWSDWFIVDDPKSIPSREGQTVQPLYASVAQASADPFGTAAIAEDTKWPDPIAFINRRLEDLAEANALYAKDQRLGAPDKIARNDREISWLKDLRSMIVLASSVPSAHCESTTVYLREVDAGTDNACWVVCNRTDADAVAFVGAA